MSSVSQPCISSQLGRVPSSPIEPVTKGRSSGSAALPSSALATPAPSSSAISITSSVACSAPAPTSIATRSPAFSTSAARSSSRVGGNDPRSGEADARVHRAVNARAAPRPRQASARRSGRSCRSPCARRARSGRARSTRWRTCAGSDAMWTYSCATSLKRRDEVDLLLVVAAERGARLLADDREHRLVVELRVVEPVQRWIAPGPGGREADAELPGELRVTAGHEGRHLLVADLDEDRSTPRPAAARP